MALDLTSEELELLREILDGVYGDLKEEVYKTEDHEYKELLKRREQTLEAVMEKVSGAAAGRQGVEGG